MCASNKPVHKNSSVSLIIHRRFAFVVATTTVVVALSSLRRRPSSSVPCFSLGCLFIICSLVNDGLVASCSLPHRVSCPGKKEVPLY